MSRASAENLYSIHKGKPFYETLVSYITSSPLIVLVIEGYRAVSVVRKLLGATFGYDAEPGTIRGDFGCSKGMNLVHGSDSSESAEREIPLFFTTQEIVEIRRCD
ncbi:MAG: nucleoside-diphosphate kinase, partial [Planctomycetes bacterium RBG_16_59_8]